MRRICATAISVFRSYGRESWWLVIACSLLLHALSASAATFSASLDRNTIALGESATLSLTFSDGTPTRISGLQVPNLAIQSLGKSTQFTMNNGAMSSSVSYNYQVTPSQAGDFVIPAVKAEVDGQVLTSQPLALRVTKGGGPTGLAFLKVIPSKETVYVGEPFTVEIQLYLAARQDSLQMPHIEGEGFTFGKVSQPTQSNTQIGNQMYTVGTFRMSAVPVKTGKLTLGPAQCSLVLHIPMGRSRSLFDDFFGGGVQRKPVTLTSDPVALNVLPLPTANQPPSFNGAIGNFTLATRASPTNVTAGDPITLHVVVSGQGNLDALPFPGDTDWPDFKLYPPTSKLEASDSLGIAGVKTFERVVIPQNPGVTALPPVKFSFFDPDQKAYRTVEASAIPIQVRPGDPHPPQPTVLAGSTQPADAAPARQDIVHIKPYFGNLTALRPPVITQPWFWLLQLIPVSAWVSAWLFRKRNERLQNNPRLRRRRAVSEQVRRGLKNLAQHAEAQDSDAFFATVFRLLQEQLGERLDLPASAITESVVDERLQSQAPAALIEQLHRLFQLCNQARYAPQRSPQELMALVPEVESALRQLRDLPGSA